MSLGTAIKKKEFSDRMHGRSIDRASLATTGALATARWGQREIKREAASRARGRR